MADRQKILFISHDASLTGAPRELLYIVKYIDRTKFEPIVLLGKDGPLREEFEANARVVIQELFDRGVKYFRELAMFSKRLKLLKELKVDLVYCNTVMTAKWLLYAKLLNLPTIVHVHELRYVFEALSSFDRYMLHNFSDKCVAASSGVRKYLLSVCSLNPSKIVIFHESLEIPPAIPPKNEALKKELFPAGCDLIVGMVGRVAQMKGTDLFIETARMVKEQFAGKIKIKFLIVGGVARIEELFYEDLKNAINLGGLSGDVVITGYKENVLDYLSLIDIFVLPSREDPFPLVVLEAMAAARPVVAFAVGGVPEALTPETGILIKEQNLEALKDAIVALVQNPERRASMGTAARRRAEENFDIAQNVSQIEELITSVISPDR